MAGQIGDYATSTSAEVGTGLIAGALPACQCVGILREINVMVEVRHHWEQTAGKGTPAPQGSKPGSAPAGPARQRPVVTVPKKTITALFKTDMKTLLLTPGSARDNRWGRSGRIRRG